MVLNRGKASLSTRASMWCTPGMPFAVGGPSYRIHGWPLAVWSSDRWKILASRQRRSISCSIAGRSTTGGRSGNRSSGYWASDMELQDN